MPFFSFFKSQPRLCPKDSDCSCIMSGYSETRVYIGRVPREGNFPLLETMPLTVTAEKRDFERFFQGFGELVEVKLMAGFAFVEFKDARDAKDAVAGTCIL